MRSNAAVSVVVWLASALANAAGPARTTVSFDADWRFLRSDAAGAEMPEFADASWRKLSVPHDWSIEGPVDPKNPSGAAGGYFPAGVGWYRKHFHLSASEAQRRVFLEFDGVMANSDVWINGFHLGRRPYGYVSFRYELTGHLRFDQENVLAVRADNSAQPASRWYSGAGIDRHVRLVIADPTHLEPGSTVVTTPQVAAGEATVRIAAGVVNQSAAARSVALEITILGADGRAVESSATAPQTIAPGESAHFEQDLAIRRPALWSLDHPALYRAVVQARAGGVSIDQEDVPFGIRAFRFDAATGFWLNGENLKLQGVCLHQDGGAFGAAVPLAVWERRLQRLKQIGVNAIRTAHNPVAPEFLDLTDRMGFVVLDEMFDTWTVGKNPYDYHLFFRDWSEIDTRDTVRRDRNHPSVVAYSAGNEIRDTANGEMARRSLRSLLDVFHREDPSRPVTQALFRPNVTHDYDNGLADMLDVVGQNYRENEILAAHQAHPERKILGTENRHEREVWLALRDHPPYAGQFLWAGIDYLGESPGWPAISADFGLLDRTGEFKPRAYQRQSWWSKTPMVHIVRRVALAANSAASKDGAAPRGVPTLLSDWTPADPSAHAESVEVYSNCEQVELALNGKSLGSQARPADEAPRVWSVTFAPGRLVATCRNQGEVKAEHELRTAGKPAKLVLTADRRRLAPAWDNVSFVTASVVDEKGVIVPGADPPISFRVTGPGAIAAVDSADLASHEPFQASQRRAFQGWCVAMVRASAAGRIVVAASAPGLIGSSVAIEGE